MEGHLIKPRNSKDPPFAVAIVGQTVAERLCKLWHTRPYTNDAALCVHLQRALQLPAAAMNPSWTHHQQKLESLFSNKSVTAPRYTWNDGGKDPSLPCEVCQAACCIRWEHTRDLFLVSYRARIGWSCRDAKAEEARRLASSKLGQSYFGAKTTTAAVSAPPAAAAGRDERETPFKRVR